MAGWDEQSLTDSVLLHDEEDEEDATRSMCASSSAEEFEGGSSTTNDSEDIIVCDGGELNEEQEQVEESAKRKQRGTPRITRAHWKKKSKNCAACLKRFKLIDRQHHCKRCGDIFCKSCLLYRKRLNISAHPDTAGIAYKVCKICFEEVPKDVDQREQGRPTLGRFRNRTGSFSELRRTRRGTADDTSTEYSGGSSQLNRVNMDKECKRLLDGFRSSLLDDIAHGSVGSMKLNLISKDILSDFRRLAIRRKQQSWKQSSVWVSPSTVTGCSGCSETWTILKGRHSCVLCGLVVCSKCSNKDLLIFIPDHLDIKDTDTKASLAIIRTIGSPDREPVLSKRLRVCTNCNQTMYDTQAAEYCMTNIMEVYKRQSDLMTKIERSLQDYQERLESLDCELTTDKRERCKHDLKILTDTQGDLSLSVDFSSFMKTIEVMKRVETHTPAQRKLIKNITQNWYGYYRENATMCKELERRVQAIAPH